MNIRLLRTDDWIGLYINGKLIAEGHSIQTIDLIPHLVPDADVRQTWNDNDLEDYGYRCPPTWLEQFEQEAK